MVGFRQKGLVLALTLILSALPVVMLSRTAFADDERFREGVKAFEEGRFEEAEKAFTDVLKKNPSSDEALSYRDEAGLKFWVQVLAKGGRLGTLARRLLKRAEVASLKERQSDEKIQEQLNKMLTTESYIEQYTLVEKLIAEHGHYVVPQLVKYLGDKREDEKRVRVIAFLKRLGEEGILAVLELLESEDSLTQQNAAIILGHIGDRRAIPALLRKVETSKDSIVTRASEESLKKIGSTVKKATEGYITLAEAYYKEHPLVMLNPYKEWVVWKWRGERLQRRLVGSYAWNEQVAEELCYDGLSVDPENRELWALLLNVTAMQWNEVTESLRVLRMIEDKGGEVDSALVEKLQADKTRLSKARMLVSSAGKDAIFDALRKALEDNNAPVAVTLIESLRDTHIDGTALPGGGSVEIKPVDSPGGLPGNAPAKEASSKKGTAKKPVAKKPAAKKPAAKKPAEKKPAEKKPDTKKKKNRNRPEISMIDGEAEVEKKGFAKVSGIFPQAAGGAKKLDGSPLCAALSFGDKRVRYAAAMAFARLNPAKAFANMEKVMENLTDAVGESGQRVILVVEPKTNLRNEIVGLCNEIGYMTFGVKSGNEALIRAKRFPAQDLVIVSSELNPAGRGDEPLEFQFVRDLRQDYRTRPIKCMILAPGAREREMKGLVDSDESVVDVITPGISKVALRDKIVNVFSSDEAKNDEKSRADKVAEKAAMSIAGLQGLVTQFKLETATDALVANCTKRPDPVRIASMKALGAIGAPARTAAVPTLLAVFKNKEENSTEVRVAAADAIGDCVKGSEIKGDVFQTLKAALKEDNTAVWNAAGYALGKGFLNGEQRLEVYKEQRLSGSDAAE